MHKSILSETQIEVLPLIRHFSKSYYLVGGTAIALHLGHRRSIDFDLFTEKKINHSSIRNLISRHGYQIDSTLFESYDQIHILIRGVKFTFLQFPYPIQANQQFENHIHIPDLNSLAAMKAFALGGRAKWKDYVDLFFLMRDHFSFSEISGKAKELFGGQFNEKLFRQQLVWHEDIDYSEKVEFLIPSPDEAEIRNFFLNFSFPEF
jgi:hypothetical protein